jgi:hypothetical protein
MQVNPEMVNRIEVFTPYITIKGKRIYRKDGKVWHFWAKPRSEKNKNKPQ